MGFVSFKISVPNPLNAVKSAVSTATNVVHNAENTVKSAVTSGENFVKKEVAAGKQFVAAHKDEFEKAKRVIDGGKELVKIGGELKKEIDKKYKKAQTAVKKEAGGLIGKGLKIADKVKNSGVVKNLGHAAGVVGFFSNVKTVGGDLLTDAKDVRTLLRDPSSKNWQKAIGDAKNTVLDGKSLVDSFGNAKKGIKALAKTFEEKAPKLAGKFEKAFEKYGAKALKDGEKLGGKLLAKGEKIGADLVEHGGKILGTAGKAAAKAAERFGKTEAGKVAVKGLEVAGKVAEKVGLKDAAKFAGKALGRFAPGVNIAIAGLDIANAVAVSRDPNASGWKKGLAWVTAAGSVVGATDIPIVAQIGSAVSVVSDVASIFVH